MSIYSDKLKDPRWQKKRLEVLNRDNWTCQMCGNTKETLHVHHKYYEKGCEIWDDENDGGLVTLCASCHTKEGDTKKHLQDFSDGFKYSSVFFYTDLERIGEILHAPIPVCARGDILDMLEHILCYEDIMVSLVEMTKRHRAERDERIKNRENQNTNEPPPF